MADNGFKINKSANFNPQAGAPANPIDGDFYYDSTAQSFAYYHSGSWAYFDSVGTVASTLWLTSAHFTSNVVRNSVVKVTGGAVLSHLAGIAASFSAKKITVYNAGTATIVVEPEDANEGTANNRILTPTGGSMNLVAGEVAVFMYDIAASRWLLVSISSNAGAQATATDVSPGIVTLHKANLTPLSGIVLSDGDIDAASGVVGLTAQRAVNIAAPLSAVTALTVTAFAGEKSAVFTGPLLLTPDSPTIPTEELGALGMESFTTGGVVRARLRSGISASELSGIRTAIAAASPWTSSSMYYWVDSECILHIRGDLFTGTNQTFNDNSTVIINTTFFPLGLRPTQQATGSCMISDGTKLIPALFYVQTGGSLAVIQNSGVNLTTVKDIYGMSVDYPLFS